MAAMREIQLTQGQVAIVDDEDYEALARFKWLAQRNRATWYAVSYARLPDGREAKVLMHRAILGVGPGVQLDHENRNKLDNRKENLRIATSRENNQNVGKREGLSSRFKGVTWRKARHKWQAAIRAGEIGPNGESRSVHLGLYDDEELAAHAYDGAALASFGRFAALNFPEVPA